MAVSVLIINADDFGYSLTVNQAILRSFERNLINSSSLMANMAGYEDAIHMIHRHAVLQGKIGVHLNLTEGYPLTRRLKDWRMFCDDSGRLVYNRQRSLIHLGRKKQDGLYGELRAQLERVLSAGIRPIHLDSHHHVHTEWAIAPLVCRLAREYGIRRIRLTRNMGQTGHYVRRLYKRVYNQSYLGRHSGFANTDYFGDIADIISFAKAGGQNAIRLSPERSYEVMVHPLFDQHANLVDLNGKDLGQQLLPILGSVADLTVDAPI